MSAGPLLPPPDDNGSFSLVRLLLPQFQSEIDVWLETYHRRVDEGQRFMVLEWRTVELQIKQDVLEISEQQKRWLEVTTEMAAAEEWLDNYGEAANQIPNLSAEEIDVEAPSIEPLWQAFLAKIRPEFERQAKGLFEALPPSWDDDLPQKTPSPTDPTPDEPDGANSPPFPDLRHYERYADRNGDDEDFDEGEFEDDDDLASEEDIVNWASASPTDVDDASEPEAPKPPQSLTQLVDSRFHPLLAQLVEGICGNFSMSVEFIYEVWPNEEVETILKEEELERYRDEIPADLEAALFPARIQRALTDTFDRANKFHVVDEDRIKKNLLEALDTRRVPELEFSDFLRKTNGYNCFQAGEIEYEGGSEMPNDGYSIQSEARALQPFDRD